MSESQWRGIFRLIFPNAADYQFADRLFKAIASARGHSQITFEDLVLSLWELTEGGRTSQYRMPQHKASTTATFVFGLMEPNEMDRVNEESFCDYVHGVFALCGSRHTIDSSVALGLPTGSIYRSKVVIII
uniref:Uncharacterized protein n=1 Tax=Heterorhabditis bacteriophora TaxID=37862 RepID=A0A1I7XUY5_HETBA